MTLVDPPLLSSRLLYLVLGELLLKGDNPLAEAMSVGYKSNRGHSI